MKKIITLHILIFLSLVCFSQTSVKVADIEEITNFIKKGELEKANEKFTFFRQNVTIKDSNYIKLIWELGYNNARCMNVEEAIRDYKEILLLIPDSKTMCLEKIGEFNFFLGDFNSSIVALNQALALAPDRKYFPY
jgi:tetratricopeptide (TPR) repeat protein